MSEHREPSPAAPSSDEPTGAQAPNDDALRLPSARPLSPPVLRSRRRQALDRARRLPWVTLALALALTGKAAECESGERERDCRQTVKVASNAVAALVCQEEYERSADPEVGALLANARLRAVDLRGATAVATALLTTSSQADALQVLGKVAYNEKRYDDAQRLLEQAAELHASEEKWSARAIDLTALGWSLSTRRLDEEALRVYQEALVSARRADDRSAETLVLRYASTPLVNVGHFPGARALAKRTYQLAQTPLETAQALYLLGDIHQEEGDFHQCVVYLEQALAALQQQQVVRLALSVHLELADCLTETGDLDRAQGQLQQAERLDTEQLLAPERLALEGRLEARRGRLAIAQHLLERALRDTNSQEPTELTDVATSLAHIALKRGDLDAATKWAMTAVSHLSQAQEQHRHAAFRSLLLTRHRRAYELLFLALARAGNAEAALSALDRWHQQSRFLELIPSPQQIVGHELSDLGPELQELSDLTRALAPHRSAIRTSPLPRAPAPLLALVVAENELWRATDGPDGASVQYLGDAKTLQHELFEPLRSSPRDPTLTTRVGALIVPDNLAQASLSPLRLLLDDELASVPFEATRIGETPLVARRPLVRVQQVRDSGCEPTRPSPQAMVLADARGDLPAARREAEIVARLLKTSAQTGASATISALTNTGTYDLLHLAVHGQTSDRGGALSLADGDLSAMQLATRGGAPPLVVLAACASGVAPTGRYSMALAYLAAGAQQVIGTLRPISDAGAAEVINRFYLQGGARDPVRALARVQAELAATDNPDWPYFAAFGRPTCASAR